MKNLSCTKRDHYHIYVCNFLSIKKYT